MPFITYFTRDYPPVIKHGRGETSSRPRISRNFTQTKGLEISTVGRSDDLAAATLENPKRERRAHTARCSLDIEWLDSIGGLQGPVGLLENMIWHGCVNLITSTSAGARLPFLWIWSTPGSRKLIGGILSEKDFDEKVGYWARSKSRVKLAIPRHVI